MRGRVFLTLAAMLCVMPHADPSRTFARRQNPQPRWGFRLRKAAIRAGTVPFEYYKQHIYVPISFAGQAGIYLHAGQWRESKYFKPGHFKTIGPAAQRPAEGEEGGIWDPT